MCSITTFLLLSYFFVVTWLGWFYHHILSFATYISWEHWVFVSIIDVKSMMCANDRAHNCLRVVFVCFRITQRHYHNYANLSEARGPLKCLQICICLRLSQLSLLSFNQYIGLHVFSLPTSVVMIVRMFTLSYYHNQLEVWNINHYLGLELGHKTAVRAVYLIMFLHLRQGHISSWSDSL